MLTKKFASEDARTCLIVLLVKFSWRIWQPEYRVSWYILIIKANKIHYFSTLFW